MKSNILAAAFVAGLPSVTLAQGIEHLGSEFGLGYSSTDPATSSESLTGLTLSIRTDWALGAQFGVQIGGATRDIELGDVQDVSLHGWYQLNDTVRLGVFGQQTATTLIPLSTTLTTQIYGIEALLEPVENASIQVYASTGDMTVSGGSVTLDHTGYGLSASYDFSPSMTGRIGFDKATQGDGGPDVSLSQMTVGADWHVNMAQLPVTVSFDYAKVDIPGGQMSRFAVTGKVMLGGKEGGKRRMFDTRFAPTYVYTF